MLFSFWFIKSSFLSEHGQFGVADFAREGVCESMSGGWLLAGIFLAV
jgi:hypothetical protein